MRRSSPDDAMREAVELLERRESALQGIRVFVQEGLDELDAGGNASLPSGGRRYRVSRKAIRDLDAIWYFIAKDNETAAGQQMDRLCSVFKAIAAQPRM